MQSIVSVQVVPQLPLSVQTNAQTWFAGHFTQCVWQALLLTASSELALSSVGSEDADAQPSATTAAPKKNKKLFTI